MTAKNLEELIAEKRQDPTFMAEIERGSAVLIAINALLVELDALRIQQGWTKADLARAAGMHPSNLRKMLSTGEKNIELETLVKLVNALGQQLSIISSGSSESFKPPS